MHGGARPYAFLEKRLLFIGWVAVALSLLGALLNARRRVLGQYLWIASNVAWIALALPRADYPQIAMWVVYLFIAVYGVWFWSRRDKMDVMKMLEGWQDEAPKEPREVHVRLLRSMTLEPGAPKRTYVVHLECRGSVYATGATLEEAAEGALHRFRAREETEHAPN